MDDARELDAAAARPACWRSIVLLALCLGGCLGASVCVHSRRLRTAAPPAPTFTDVVVVPTADGAADLGQFLKQMAASLGLEGTALTEALASGPSSLSPRACVESLAAMSQGVISIEDADGELSVRIDRLQLRREDKRLRSGFGKLMGEWFPELAAEAAAAYGITVYNADGPVAPTAALAPEAVLLVHGLDEPGNIWSALLPLLREHGFQVCTLDYPNDQALADSAKLLARELASLRQRGVQTVSLAAHSMGGLVSREFLTNPTFYLGDAERERYPRVRRLIMIGTPNQGSEMARLRLASEVRDQIVRTFSGDGILFGSIFDGAGEAQLDLLPGSDFLTALNQRAHPKDVLYTIIAGRASPVTAQSLAGLDEKTLAKWGVGADAAAARLRQALATVANGVGDGVVTLTSSRLAGVEDYHVVEANHETMLYQVLSDSELPPALPLILERLRRDRGDTIE